MKLPTVLANPFIIDESRICRWRGVLKDNSCSSLATTDIIIGVEGPIIIQVEHSSVTEAQRTTCIRAE